MLRTRSQGWRLRDRSSPSAGDLESKESDEMKKRGTGTETDDLETVPATDEDATPVTPDRSGWTPHPSERRDFWNRIRAFPPEVVGWRKRLIKELAESPGRFRLATGLAPGQLQERLDAGISHLREVARILAVLYGTPDLGNKPDPTDELVYIILARKTREGAYQQGSIRSRSGSDVGRTAGRPAFEVEKLVFSGGLSGKKITSLYAALGKLRDTFGSCTLEPARDWPDEKLKAFLCELPEIQRKSAYCVMMYSFGRKVFPADTHVGRVLSRIGPYRELGLSLEGLDHKKLQRELAELMPPNLRYSLHVNLVEHGRAVCRSPKPLCEKCELRNLCRYYRSAESARSMETESPSVIDLFAGAGGSSEGFSRAGFKTLAAVEMDEMAARTYRLNHPAVPDDRVIVQDIRTLSTEDLRRLAGEKPLDVLAGSPPCQGFSSVGFRSKKTLLGYRPEEDDRNMLYETMIEAALALKPKLFLLENVPGMKSAKRKTHSFLDTAAKLLETHGGYQTEIWCLNASAFGVPQDRIRLFLVASRLKVMPVQPTADYQDTRRPEHDHDALPRSP